MSKARITYEIIAGVLSICTIGGTTAMCVPNSQTKIADYTAENLSPKYAQIMELTKEQQDQIKNLEIDIDENGKVIINLQANLDKANQDNEKIINDLSIANGLIKDKDSQIASLQDDKTTLSNEINSLTEQKTQVQSLYEQGLITIEERNATISNLNSQINDKNTLIEQKTSQITILENEKQQLQTQVEELTNQKTQLEQDVSSLNQEKATLQAEVTQLRQEKAELQNQIKDLQSQLKILQESKGIALEQDFSYVNIGLKDNRGASVTVHNNLKDYLNSKHHFLFNTMNYSYGEYCYFGSFLKSFNSSFLSHIEIYSIDLDDFHSAAADDKTISDISITGYSIDGVDVENFEALDDNKLYYIFVSNLNTEEKTCKVNVFKLNKYEDESGNYIDFKNKKINFNNTLVDFSFVSNDSFSIYTVSMDNDNYYFYFEVMSSENYKLTIVDKSTFESSEFILNQINQ